MHLPCINSGLSTCVSDDDVTNKKCKLNTDGKGDLNEGDCIE